MKGNKVNNEDMIENVEVSISEAKEVISTAEALERLMNNTDFKVIILEGYFKDYAAELVMAKSSSGLEGEDQQRAILKSIDGIGQLYQYFSKVFQSGQMMEKTLMDSEQAREELLNDGAV